MQVGDVGVCLLGVEEEGGGEEVGQDGAVHGAEGGGHGFGGGVVEGLHEGDDAVGFGDERAVGARGGGGVVTMLEEGREWLVFFFLLV